MSSNSNNQQKAQDFKKVLDQWAKADTSPTYSKGQSDRIIDGLAFKLRTSACPEQWDVYKSGVKVAYVRLRHGYLKVMDADHSEIWWDNSESKDFDHDGVFATEADRNHYLTKIAGVVNEYIEGSM